MLNVPIYADGYFNMSTGSLSSTIGITTTSGPVSTGFGVSSFSVRTVNTVLISYNLLPSYSVANIYLNIFIYRSTTTIPAAGNSTGTDIAVFSFPYFSPPVANAVTTASGSFYYPGITLGTPYSYYVALQSTGGTYNMNSGSMLSVAEAK